MARRLLIRSARTLLCGSVRWKPLECCFSDLAPPAKSDLRIAEWSRIDDRSGLCSALRAGTQTDNGTLIARAYQKWGVNFPAHLLGDYAIAIFDASQSRLLLFQSPFAFKPLYFTEGAKRFVFADNARTVLQLSGESKRLDAGAFSRFLNFRQSTGDLDTLSMFAGIRNVPAGHYLSVTANQPPQLTKWWSPEEFIDEQPRKFEDSVAQMRSHLLEAVVDRTPSTGKVACNLSGGLDSSTITAIAAESAGTSSLICLANRLPDDYAGTAKDESPFIASVAQHIGISVQTPASTYTMNSQLEGYWSATERPVEFANHFQIANLEAAARQRGATRLLCGLYGEFGPSFHGRGVFAWLAKRGRLIKLFKLLSGYRKHTQRSWANAIRTKVLSPLITRPRNLFAAEESLLTEFQSVKERYREPVLRMFEPESQPKRLLLGHIQHAQRFQGMPSEAEGIETAYPFLDRRVIEFCLATPSEHFVGGGWPRSLIRHATKGWLPEDIRWRRTKGSFMPNFYEVFLDLWQEIRDEFSAVGPNESIHEFIDTNRVIAALDYLRDRDGTEVSPEGNLVKIEILKSLQALYFLRWFDAVQIPPAASKLTNTGHSFNHGK